MAERIQVELVDDIDGSPAKHTVTFALDGVSYEIDLNDGHAKELRTVLDRYIGKARSPEAGATATSKRQRKREDETNRRANQQLTDQIRGAAQRSRDQRNRQQSAEPEDATHNGADQHDTARGTAKHEKSRPVTDSTEPDLQAWSRVERSADVSESSALDASEEQEDAAAPAVALPLFSSATD